MELSKCLGCMEPFQGCPCPKCGFDPKNVKGAEYALPLETILAGKYLVGRVLGQGGFGITYIGWDIALERKVAIKEYFPTGQVSRNPGTRDLTWYTSEQSQRAKQDGMQMFLKEARKMSKVDDIPNVVRVRDLFQENGTAYIVMDFVEGETLKARLQRTGPMSWAQAKEIFLPAIQAMEQVHKAGLVHRDLSPDNLMLTPEGRVMILDLGAAKDLSVNNGASSMQVAKGGFSPFEQYTQRGASGPWTDVYAMAATLYFTLTGKLPPVATDRVDEDTISWTEPALKALPAPALEALQKAMEVSARKRTQSMAELEQGLLSEKKKTEVRQTPKPEQLEQKKRGLKPEIKKKRVKIYCAVVTAVVAVLCGILAWVIGHSGRISQLSAGYDCTVGLRKDGSVAITAPKYNVTGWENIVDISAGGYYVVGLRGDGTVATVGDNRDGQRNVGGWQGICAIAAGGYHTVGLRRDGTVQAVGDNSYSQCDVGKWKNIIAISAGDRFTIGLHTNGTVVAAGQNDDGECNVFSWRNIKEISAGGYHTVGLRSDSTVVAAGYNSDGQCNVERWADIVAIAAGYGHTVGLRRDGTVVATGWNAYGQCNVSDWTDIVAIAAGYGQTVGIRRDGTVIAVGTNDSGECNVEKW